MDIIIVFGSTTTGFKEKEVSDQKQKLIAREFINKYVISQKDTHIGLVTYTSFPETVIELRDGTRPLSVQRSLDMMSITRGDGLLNTLKYLTGTSFTARQGARPDVSRQVVLILNMVDSQQSDIQKQIKTLKDAGIEMTTINTESKTGDDSRNDPTSDVYFFPDELDAIDRLLDQVVAGMNQGNCGVDLLEYYA